MGDAELSAGNQYIWQVPIYLGIIHARDQETRRGGSGFLTRICVCVLPFPRSQQPLCSTYIYF